MNEKAEDLQYTTNDKHRSNIALTIDGRRKHNGRCGTSHWKKKKKKSPKKTHHAGNQVGHDRNLNTDKYEFEKCLNKEPGFACCCETV